MKGQLFTGTAGRERQTLQEKTDGENLPAKQVGPQIAPVEKTSKNQEDWKV